MALARGHLARYIARGQGSKLIDIDGHEYTDLSLSHGAGVLGHDHPAIRAAVLEALSVGTVCSMDTRYHSPASRPRGGRPRRRRQYLIRCALRSAQTPDRTRLPLGPALPLLGRHTKAHKD